MARESALWLRVKTGVRDLARTGYRVKAERIENATGRGNPDVDACIDGQLFKVELKTCERPKRPLSKLPIHSNPKTKAAQRIWHAEWYHAGCRAAWVLVQVGEAQTAALYLIPGQFYETIYTLPEQDLWMMSKCEPTDDMASILRRAAEGY